MSESIEDYVFDFEREVNRVFKEYPCLVDDTVFISCEEGRKSIYAVKKARDLYESSQLPGEVQCARGSGGGECPTTGAKVVILDARDDTTLPPCNDISRLFTLYHELGHILARSTPSANYDENAADAFASIRLLQRFGKEAAPQLAHLSCLRSYAAMLYRDLNHLTVLTVEQIMQDRETANFNALSPGETLARAMSYAGNHSPSGREQLIALRTGSNSLLSYSSERRRIKLLASTALASGDKFSFQLGFALFRPLLSAEGVNLLGKKIQFGKNTRKKLHASFTEHACRLGLDHIVAELEENRADMLKEEVYELPFKRQAQHKIKALGL